MLVKSCVQVFCTAGIVATVRTLQDICVTPTHIKNNSWMSVQFRPLTSSGYHSGTGESKPHSMQNNYGCASGTSTSLSDLSFCAQRPNFRATSYRFFSVGAPPPRLLRCTEPAEVSGAAGEVEVSAVYYGAGGGPWLNPGGGGTAANNIHRAHHQSQTRQQQHCNQPERQRQTTGGR